MLEIYKQQIKSGEAFIVDGVFLTKDQHERYIAAIDKAEELDILQGVRKVLL